VITVDGSTGEGGGQMLRTTLTLSILTRQAVEIRDIRASRPKPGLRPQHLAAVRAAAEICGAEVAGATLDSRTVRFAPGGPARCGAYTFDVARIAGQGSAGAVGLLLQTVLLPLALADGPSDLTLRGGTHVPWAPSVDYLQSVFLPTVARMGVAAEVELVDWGFYPAGGGEVRVRIAGQAASLAPLQQLERGSCQRVWGRAVASNLPAHIPQRMVNRARNLLAEAGLSARLEPLRVRSAGPGAAIFLFVAYEQAVGGFAAHGRKGLPSEHVAEAACQNLLSFHRAGAPVEPHLADQLALPMALAAGTSRMAVSSITNHLLTNLAVIRHFVPAQAQVGGARGTPGTVTIRGVQLHD